MWRYHERDGPVLTKNMHIKYTLCGHSSFTSNLQCIILREDDDDVDDGQKLIITARMNGTYACKLQRACIFLCVHFPFCAMIKYGKCEYGLFTVSYHSAYPVFIHSISFMNCFWCQPSDTAVVAVTIL